MLDSLWPVGLGKVLMPEGGRADVGETPMQGVAWPGGMQAQIPSSAEWRRLVAGREAVQPASLCWPQDRCHQPRLPEACFHEFSQMLQELRSR